MNFNDLPNELLLIIFNFLNLIDQNELNKICKKWRILVPYKNIKERLKLINSKKYRPSIINSFNSKDIIINDGIYNVKRNLFFLATNEGLKIYNNLQLVKFIEGNVNRLYIVKNYIISMNPEGIFRYYNLKSFKLFKLITTKTIFIINFVEKNDIIYFIVYNNSNIYSIVGDKIKIFFKGNNNFITTLAIGYRKYIYAGTRNGSVVIIKNNKHIEVLNNHQSPISILKIEPETFDFCTADVNNKVIKQTKNNIPVRISTIGDLSNFSYYNNRNILIFLKRNVKICLLNENKHINIAYKMCVNWFSSFIDNKGRIVLYNLMDNNFLVF